MFGIAIIVFRETLEAALIIGILSAATRSIARHSYWIAGGAVAGLLGAGIVASLAGQIATLFDGMGQDLFNATILGVAVLLLGWHQIWMTIHSKELAADANQLGKDVREGRRELSAVLVIVGIAVLREGAESVLFVYGLMSGNQLNANEILAGSAVGVCVGGLLGLLLYVGMLRIPLRWFFSATSILILLLAAGMASRMTKFLIQSDILPSLRAPMWDTSSALPIDSVPGVLLHALAGYDPAPDGMQIVFYVATLFIILAGMRLVKRKTGPSH